MDVHTFHFHDALKRIATLVASAQRHMALTHNLRDNQLHILTFLARATHEHNTLTAIAQHFGLSRGSLSQSLKTLETRELIMRQNDALDKRISHLILTPKGQAIVHHANEHILFPHLDLSDTIGHVITTVLPELAKRLEPPSLPHATGHSNSDASHDQVRLRRQTKAAQHATKNTP